MTSRVLSGQISQAWFKALTYTCFTIQTMTPSLGELWKLRSGYLGSTLCSQGTSTVITQVHWRTGHFFWPPLPTRIIKLRSINLKNLNLAKNCLNKENNWKKSRQRSSLISAAAEGCFVAKYRQQPMRSYSSFVVWRNLLTKLLKLA